MRLAVLASGSGTNLQAILDSCNGGNIPAKVVAVISDKKDALALKRAEKHDVATYFVNALEYSSREDMDKVVVKLLKQHNVDLVILAGYMRLLSTYFIKQYPNKIMNIHPSLLPAFPGTQGVIDALDYGVKITGCTVHFVDEGLDTGPIILQSTVKVGSNDNPETLHKKIHEQEYRLYSRAIDLFARGKITVKGRRCIVDE